MTATAGDIEQYDAIVLGAGVVGLTTALELAQKGLKVVIVTRDLPEDIHSTSFSSPWAGASFAPWAENEADVSREERTFLRLSALADTHPHLVQWTKYRYGWNTEGAYPTPLSSRYFPDWRSLEPEECPGPFKRGVGFTSITINPATYTLHLLAQLEHLGVKIHRHRVSSIFEAFSINLPSTSTSSTLSSSLVINATGLGSLSLLGVLDPLVHPAKGQTISIRAPLVTECLGWKEPRRDPAEKGQQVYIIPRPGSDGLVTVGGCYLPNKWSTNVDPDIAARILREAVELCPELVDPNTGKVEVISHNVGLRPCRKGGIRIEKEEFDLDEVVAAGNDGILPGAIKRGVQSSGKVTCVHAYGIGGAGYQDSFGIAEDVAELVMAHLARKQPATATQQG